VELDRFTAINGALQVDLFGQVNLEWQSDRLISGVGGAPDFMQAAVRAAGGRSIIALASTAKGGEVSRIVPRLEVPAVSIARSEIDTVVTEHGIAELKGRSVDERAEVLMAVAGKQHQAALAQAWRAMRARL